MSLNITIIPLLLALGMLAGCQSAPLHLYTLAPPRVAFDTVESAYTQTSFLIDEVRIPKSIDRKELIVRKDVSELVVLDDAQWSTPLREEVKQALRVNLERALATEPSRSLTLVDVWVIEWEATPQLVYFKAEWRLRQAQSAKTVEVRCESAFTERTTGTPEDLVRAHRSLMQALAQPIARVLRRDPLKGCGL